MILPDKIYNVLKWIALIVLPAFSWFYAQLGELWSLPYTDKISNTIALVGLLIGALIGVSTYTYNKNQKVKEE